MKKIYNKFLNVTETRALVNEGYKYSVECDYKTLGTTDPWSGMPNIGNNLAVFKDKAEAETFAVTQRWPFNPNEVHANVETLVWGETWEEREARVAREKAERAAKKAEREARNAAKAGLTVEEYRKAKAKEREVKALTREIEEMEKELARKREMLKELTA